MDILRLRRRFLKDQEKLSLIYAKKSVVEQKREKVCIFLKIFGQKYLLYTKEMSFLPDIGSNIGLQTKITEAALALYNLKLFMNQSLLQLIKM